MYEKMMKVLAFSGSLNTNLEYYKNEYYYSFYYFYYH